MNEQWKDCTTPIYEMEFEEEEAAFWLADAGGVSDFGTINCLRDEFEKKVLDSVIGAESFEEAMVNYPQDADDQWKLKLFEKGKKAEEYLLLIRRRVDEGVLAVERRLTHKDWDGKEHYCNFINGEELQKICCEISYFPEILLPVESSVICDYLQKINIQKQHLEQELEQQKNTVTRLESQLAEETAYRNPSHPSYINELHIQMDVWWQFKDDRSNLLKSPKEKIEDYLAEKYPDIKPGSRLYERIIAANNWQPQGGTPASC
ncbi:hypothetical protein [Endozoicomonas arenosclerae]|uniref:hypothetical protein n=1 Tax=Endozoicomonas arenosclerae TaxID=1633495 RepID=UPI00078370E2|nr:hypothetical protein [Endozoicomonas arenosclerae]